MQDEHFMKLAIEEAKKAEALKEVPIGAVLVHDGKVISKGYNLRETTQRSITHAEIMVIDQACEALQTWRLEEATLYVTLEPCPMCAGAIIQSRIKKVVYGAKDPKAGCAGTLMNILQDSRFNHQTEVVSGIMEEECGELLSSFFKKLRQQKKEKKLRESNS
ncbi:tRNA adenosine(34) deaminase TadA [Sutcliffiella horikoshii]|uniref:tRNA-specific adenosine deaminase n=1 Tax=Sutcliffiella horikoshii TaxID=79883 RepID=A0A1Y0CHW8_9BACI|nr:tRNA adenosine(34) deaminase TadA [Sutcliffiella horikoshii]ART74577.1 tRNA adenosine(34) deaminase TadA [Sutcliffiella horikoshii]TYS53616.1 tRNA adenosine(34) deaminase TadA [Sutcliffiella horikoshii]